MGVLDQNDGGVIKIWGTSENDLYFVGYNGTIVHYNESGWAKIESGTALDINDIWGFENNNKNFIKYIPADNQILRLSSENVISKITTFEGSVVNSLWAKSDNLIYCAGDGLTILKNGIWEKPDNSELNLIFRIKASDYNNIAGLSSNREVYHYNGYTWSGIVTEQNNTFVNVETKQNIIATVGWQDNKALITLLRRNN